MVSHTKRNELSDKIAAVLLEKASKPEDNLHKWEKNNNIHDDYFARAGVLTDEDGLDQLDVELLPVQPPVVGLEPVDTSEIHMSLYVLSRNILHR